MIRRAVVLAPEARDDLVALYDWIAEATSPETALRFIERIEDYIGRFDLAAERGARHDHIRPGLRTIGFEGRLTIAFAVGASTVTILRVFYRGRNWLTELS